MIFPDPITKKLSIVLQQHPYLNEAGVYGFWNTVTNDCYVGESVKMIRRLRNEIADCRNNNKTTYQELESLKKDWSTFGEEKFQIVVFDCGEKYQSLNYRATLETLLIEMFKSEGKSYNRASEVYFKPGERAFADESDKEQLRRERIRQSKKNTPFPMAKTRGTPGNVPLKVFVEGVIYPSLSAAAAARGLNRESVRKRCNNENYPEWRFVD